MVIEASENTAQKVDQKNERLQQTLNTINTILNQNGKEVNVDEIDDILNREFLKSTEAIADKILDAISALPSEIQKDPEVQKIINAFKVQSVSGNNEGNSNRAKAEASSLTDDMDPLNTMISLNRKDKKEINKLISDCQKYTQGADIYKNLDRNLNAIKNILSKETTTLRELKQIDDFLKNNNISTLSRSKDNIQPLLTGVTDFLKQVKTALEKNKEGDKVLKEHQEKKEQQEKEQQERIARQEQMQKEKEATDLYEKNLRLREESKAFHIFVHMIPNDMGNLSQFTENEITNIIGFISDSKNEAQIGSNQNPKTDVLNLYFTMNRYAQLLDTDKAPNGKKITKYDRERFNQIFDHIKTVYANNNGTNEIAEYELSSIITTDSIKDKAPKNRDGRDLTQNDDKFINDNYGGRSFTAEGFRTKFNSVNAERKEKNKQALKESIKIDNTLITNELLNKITLTEEGEGEGEIKTIKLTYKQGDTSEPAELNADNFITTLGLNIDTKNIDFLGNEKEEAIAELQNDRFKELMDYKKKQKPNPTEKPEEKLEDLDPDMIKNNLRCGLNANDIAKFYNEAKKKNDLNQEQKKLLLLTQKGLTHQDRTNDDVKELQTQLKFEGKSVDGRFGSHTYGTLKLKFPEIIVKNNNKYEINIEEPFQDNLLKTKQRLSNENLIIPGKNEILNALNGDEDTTRYLQLCLKPYYKGSIDGQIGNRTLEALSIYIRKCAPYKNNSQDIVTLANIGSDKPNHDIFYGRINNKNSFAAIKQPSKKDTYKAYFFKGEEFTIYRDNGCRTGNLIKSNNINSKGPFFIREKEICTPKERNSILIKELQEIKPFLLGEKC